MARTNCEQPWRYPNNRELVDSQILPSALSLIQKGWSIKLFPRPLQRRVILPNEFMSSVPIPDRTSSISLRIQLPLAENSTEDSKI